MKIKTTTLAAAREMLESGSFVTVVFEKRDGTIRKLNGRSGVKKGVKGVGMAYDKDAKGIVILYETNKPEDAPAPENYRAVRLDSIVEFAADGKRFKIAENSVIRKAGLAKIRAGNPHN